MKNAIPIQQSIRKSIQNEVLFNKHVSPMKLKNRLHSEYNINLPYWKIWRAKKNLLNDHFNPFYQISLLKSYSSKIIAKNESLTFSTGPPSIRVTSTGVTMQ